MNSSESSRTSSLTISNGDYDDDFEESFEVIDSLLSGYSAAPSSLNESIQESENASAETSEGPIDDINLIENYYQKALSLKSEEVIILSRRVQDCNLQIIKLGNQLKESEDEKLLLARKLAVLEEKLLTLRIRDGQMIREILELDAKCVEFHGGSPSQGTDEVSTYSHFAMDFF
uniref:Biogenesis of lysosome-related organelles complex 1 subunit KXD1 n=1 Tax=Syphacia muris TaxID=451379 RepID=A0A0N5ADT1_9BILA